MTPTELFHVSHARIREYDLSWVELFAPDGVLELPFAPAPMPRRVVGREAIRTLLAPHYTAARAAGRRLAGYRNLVVHETRDPEVIVVEFEVDVATGEATQRLAFIQVYRVAGGQIRSPAQIATQPLIQP